MYLLDISKVLNSVFKTFINLSHTGSNSHLESDKGRYDSLCPDFNKVFYVTFTSFKILRLTFYPGGAYQLCISKKKIWNILLPFLASFIFLASTLRMYFRTSELFRAAGRHQKKQQGKQGNFSQAFDYRKILVRYLFL